MTHTKKTKKDEYCDWMKIQVDANQAREQQDEFMRVLKEIPSM